MTGAAEAPPTHCTQAEFARLQGWSKSYVTKLKGEGRLVLDDAGLVDVQASLAKITGSTGAPERAAPAVVSESRSRKEHYDAELSRLQYEERIGSVLLADEVQATVTDAATRLRVSLEAWPAQLAQLAALGGDAERIRMMLDHEVQRGLAELSRGFGALAQQQPKAA